jgi:hypothetical protein
MQYGGRLGVGRTTALDESCGERRFTIEKNCCGDEYIVGAVSAVMVEISFPFFLFCRTKTERHEAA